MKNVKILSKAFGLIMLSAFFLGFAACDPTTIQLKPEETEVTYTVEHYLQKVSGQGYEAIPDYTESLKGMTGFNTDARAKDYEGFEAQTFFQQKLEQNKTTVIKIYYNRKTIVYTFDAGDGKFADGESCKTSTGLYGASVAAPDNPEKEGFDFTKWDEIVPDTFGAENRTFTAEWTQKTSQGEGNESGEGQGENQGQGEEATAEYTVELYTQNKLDDDYSRYSSDIFTGKIGENTKALAPGFAGFTVKSIEEKPIAADGSTIVKIYYDRKIIKYTFDAGDGHFADGSKTKVVSGRYETSVPTVEWPSYKGYYFEGWDKTIPYEFGEKDLSFNASWEFGANTTYTLICWEQNISDNNYTKTGEYTIDAPAGKEVTADPLPDTGFTIKPVSPVTVAADGSTVLNVYFDRKLITYTFEANGGNWNGSTSDVVVKGKFGASVIAPANPGRAGYDFFDWDYNIPETFGGQNRTFIAWWSTRKDTPYTVEYWLQNVNDNGYTRQDEDTQHGTGETDTDIRLEYHGFETQYAGFIRSSYTNLNIAGDGSTVVKFYYNRKSISYTFKANEGNWNGSTDDVIISGRYGAAVNIPLDPVRINHAFTRWEQANGEDIGTNLQTFASSNRIFIAQWEYNEDIKNYTVNHFLQNIDNNEYTLDSSDTESGVSGQTTTAVAKTYPGFTTQTFTQETIATDNNTVVNIYYNRNFITYTFQLYGGSINGLAGNKTETKRFGQSVTKPADPVKENYTFRDWYSDSSFKNLYDFTSTPSKNTTIYAGWNYNPIQINEKISINGTEYTKTEEVYVIDPANTGDDITVVQGKPYISSNTNGPFKEGRTNSLSPFIMGKYEVTQELYTTVMTNQKVTVDGVAYTLDASPFICLQTGDYQLAEGENQNLRPAENMTWYDAVYFCNKLTEMVDGNDSNLVYTINIHTVKDGHITNATVTLDLQKSGYRLPTQTEWEFAFRGGNPYIEAWDYLFSGSPSLEDSIYAAENTGLDPVGWYKKNSDTKTHEVGKKSPNALGIYDMSGNVEEWCYDWQDALSTGSYSNYTGGASSSVKIVRGGGFNNNAGVCSNYHIDTIFPETKDRSRGFRLARSVTQ